MKEDGKREKKEAMRRINASLPIFSKVSRGSFRGRFHRSFLQAFITILLFLLASILPGMPEALGSPSPSPDPDPEAQAGIVGGYVFASDTRLPIQNARILLLYAQTSYRRILVASSWTDALGSFRLNTGYEGWHRVYVLADRPETPGIDYVPCSWDVYIQKGAMASYTFNLLPAATIFVKGEIRFVESPNPASEWRFTVLSPERPLVSPSISLYGMVQEASEMGLNRSYAIVPADVPVSLRVWARSGSVSHEFVLGADVGYYRLPQGSLLEVDGEREAILFNAALVKGILDKALEALLRAEDTGFLVVAERQDVLRSMGFLDSARLYLKQGRYYDAYASLRRAWMLGSDASQKLQSLFDEGRGSAYALTIFFAFTSIALVYLLVERTVGIEIAFLRRRVVFLSLTPIILAMAYGSMMAVFFIAFPGCRLIDPLHFILMAFLSLALGYAAMRLPGLLEERKGMGMGMGMGMAGAGAGAGAGTGIGGAGIQGRSLALRGAIIASFSIAARNLRRRRLRTGLTLATVAIMAFGFITTTSIAAGRGLVLHTFTPLLPKALPDGWLLVEDVEAGEMFVSLRALPENFILWLEGQPNVTRVVAKAESPIHRDDMPLGYARTVSGDFAEVPIHGILGIEPSLQAEMMPIKETIVRGEYLKDGEDDGIMISSKLAELLKVDVGDYVIFESKYRIVGIFDDDAFKSLLEPNGDTILPKLLNVASEIPFTYDCPPSSLIVMTLEEALKFPKVGILGASVRMETGRESLRDLLNLGERIALIFEYVVSTSLGGSVYTQYVGPYTEEKGLGWAPLVMVLTALIVATTMFSAVEERRGELAILSSIGLNPAHIASIFMAEALIIGFIGGGIGHLAGITGYRAMERALGSLGVREKVSASWSMASFIVAIMATVLGTLIPAMKASTIVTPSLLRRWSVEQKPAASGYIVTTLDIDLPVKVRTKEVEALITFMLKSLRGSGSFISGLNFIESKEKEKEMGIAGEFSSYRIPFTYAVTDLVVENELFIFPEPDGEYYSAKLICNTGKRSITLRATQEVGSFIRKLILEWNAYSFRVAAPLDPLSQVYTLIQTYSPKVLNVAYTGGGADASAKLTLLRERLAMEKARVPRIALFPVDPTDIKDCMKKARAMAAEADVVCVSGDSSPLSAALALAASEEKKVLCYVEDPRPPEERRAEPFIKLRVATL